MSLLLARSIIGVMLMLMPHQMQSLSVKQMPVLTAKCLPMDNLVLC